MEALTTYVSLPCRFTVLTGTYYHQYVNNNFPQGPTLPKATQGSHRGAAVPVHGHHARPRATVTRVHTYSLVQVGAAAGTQT